MLTRATAIGAPLGIAAGVMGARAVGAGERMNQGFHRSYLEAAAPAGATQTARLHRSIVMNQGAPMHMAHPLYQYQQSTFRNPNHAITLPGSGVPAQTRRTRDTSPSAA